jgi:cell division protein FtsI (penicillin-binding protein 3)
MSRSFQPEDPLQGVPLGGERAHVKKRKSFFTRMYLTLFSMRLDKSGHRLYVAMLAFVCVFGMISSRLVMLATQPDEASNKIFQPDQIAKARPDIVDRNGVVLATDFKSYSIYVEPRRLIDKDEAVELLTAVLPELNARQLRDKFSTKRGAVLIKRRVSQEVRDQVFRLGLTGAEFPTESQRYYPNGVAAAHVLGATDVDNKGISGIEKYIDGQGLSDLAGVGLATKSTDLKPVKLTLDLRVQHALRDELIKGMEKFKAKAVGGMVIDVTTGEVIALTSLPDFDPNNPIDALDPDKINRVVVGTYEMGSTYKALTLAMAMDSGKATINSQFDARTGLRYGKFEIKDFHPTHRILTIPEIFIHSSNIGTAKAALAVGVDGHKAFLKKLGQLDRLRTELPESAEPQKPSHWGELETVTIAFGHGLAVAPIQSVMAVCALVNGGNMMPPTFLPRSQEEADAISVKVIKPETSEAMRYLMRLNAANKLGTAGKADIDGYFVGGKTGTANKNFHGHYDASKVFTTFMAIVPADKPKYLFMTIMDEPQAVPGTFGYQTAGWNAGPVTGAVIERTAPFLDLPKRFEPPVAPFPTMVKLGAWGTK